MELMPKGRRLRRADVRRVVVVIPSAFTLGNLFFGLWAIVAAYNGNFRWAAWFIVFAALLDMMDGRLALRSIAALPSNRCSAMDTWPTCTLQTSPTSCVCGISLARPGDRSRRNIGFEASTGRTAGN